MSAPDSVNTNTSVLLQLGQVQGQLLGLTQMIQSQHDSTNKRLDDFRHSVEDRLNNVEDRVTTVEGHERGTALRAAGSGAMASAIITAVIEGLKFVAHR